MVPTFSGDVHVDLREHGDEVIVVADLHGLKKNVTLQLLNPRALEIPCQRWKEKEDGYYGKERISGSMRPRSKTGFWKSPLKRQPYGRNPG
jgi:HSP20 family protein